MGRVRRIRHAEAGLLLVLLLLLVITGSTSAAHDPIVLHVDDDAPPGGDGLTWTTAHRYLQDALAAARKPGSEVVEIRIAGGVYKPDRSEAAPEGTGDREVSFELVSGVALRGGYAGLGFADPDFRSLEVFETIVSGDLAGDDGPPGSFENYGENSLYVVRGVNPGPGALLEGITITAGNNSLVCGAPPVWPCRGAGINIVRGSLDLSRCRIRHNRAASGGAGGYFENATVSITDSVIEGNFALNSAGGLDFDEGELTVLDCEIRDNRADIEDGGGLRARLSSGEIRRTVIRNNRADDGAGLLLIATQVDVIDCLLSDNHANSGGGAVGGRYRNCQFIGNSAFFAGALRGSSATTVVDCTFRDNYISSVFGSGGAIAGGTTAGGQTIVNCIFENDRASENGGALNLNAASSVVNCFFHRNSADYDGGAVFTDHEDITLVNCTIIENEAGAGGGAVAGPVSVSNCILWRNLPIQLLDPEGVRYSCIQGGWPGEGNISADPLFTGRDDLHLSGPSPCIDAGDTPALPADVTDLDGDGDFTESLPVDLASHPRLTDRTATPDSGVPVDSLPVVDMGAVEFQAIVFGDLDGDDRVGITDLLVLLDAWGSCPPHGAAGTTIGCQGDLDRDGEVGGKDLLLLLANW